jgi:hypothetical protein
MLVGLAEAIGKSSVVATRRKLIRAIARDQLALVFAFCQIWCNCGAFAPYFFYFPFFLLVGVFWRGSYALLPYLFFLLHLYLGMHRGCVVGYEQINTPM